MHSAQDQARFASKGIVPAAPTFPSSRILEIFGSDGSSNSDETTVQVSSISS